jgi:hypothetical protein
VASTIASATLNVGFLTVVREASGYLGGYLVTNQWGRPLEFRLSTAVQPNRVQHILYGETLRPYICADLIGKTLIEKTTVTPHLIVTDCLDALDLRLRVEVPVLCLAAPDSPEADHPPAQGAPIRPAAPGKAVLLRHARFADDQESVSEILQRLEGALALAEPFQRVREAMNEARKMGVTGRG